MSTTLRPASDTDIDAIAALWHRGWCDAHVGHVPAALLRHRRRRDFRRLAPARLGETTVATIAAVVVGFVVVHDDEIEQLYVDGAARGHGVAPRLLDRGEDAIAQAFDRAWLAVAAGNARARRFYERHGWFDVGAFTYCARTAAGPSVAVPVRRYEKHLNDHTEGLR